MKMLIIGSLAVIGLAFSIPAGAAPLVTSSEVIAGQSDEMFMQVRARHGNRGLHRGWTQGRHYGRGRGRGHGRR